MKHNSRLDCEQNTNILAAARSKLSVEELKINAKSLVAQQRKEERAAYAEVR